MKKSFLIIGLPVIALIAIAAVIGWYSFGKSMRIKTIDYDSQLLILEGGGGNSIVLKSEDGNRALVVDTKMGSAAKRLASQVKAKDVIVVNTHVHLDHTGGNKLFPDVTLIAGAYTQDQWKGMAKTARYPDVTVQAGKDTVIDIGNETVRIRNMGQAHSWDDVVVYLENRNLLMTGDIIFNHMHPAMFVQGGTKAAAWMAALDTLIHYYPSAKVLPGHGVFSDVTALLEMKEYFLTIRDAIGDQEKLNAAKAKYRGYHGFPGLTGFDKTVAFMKKEMRVK